MKSPRGARESSLSRRRTRREQPSHPCAAAASDLLLPVSRRGLLPRQCEHFRLAQWCGRDRTGVRQQGDRHCICADGFGLAELAVARQKTRSRAAPDELRVDVGIERLPLGQRCVPIGGVEIISSRSRSRDGRPRAGVGRMADRRHRIDVLTAHGLCRVEISRQSRDIDRQRRPAHHCAACAADIDRTACVRAQSASRPRRGDLPERAVPQLPPTPSLPPACRSTVRAGGTSQSASGT